MRGNDEKTGSVPFFSFFSAFAGMTKQTCIGIARFNNKLDNAI